MSKLTAERVRTILDDCLFREAEIVNEPKVVPDGAVEAEGIRCTFCFHPERLEKHKAEIGEMLSELPEEFKGGWSFLNACMTKDGEHWGEHPSVEALMVLGLATKQIIMLLPRNHWYKLPSGMPYFCTTVGVPTEEQERMQKTYRSMYDVK